MNNGKIKKIVLTGGPCAGKTTITQVISHVFREEITVLPESASMLFSAGFPRWSETCARKSTQKAIYHVQRELEACFSIHFPEKILVLDRGTVDGAAYWPEGTDEFFRALNTTITQELACYDFVLYLESASEKDYLVHKKNNPNRFESWEEARKLDEETQKLWSQHPQYRLIKNQRAFSAKISEVFGEIEKAIRPME